MIPFAELEDLKAHWEGLPEELHESAEHKLLEASVIVRSIFPNVDARIASGKLLHETVTYVVVDMVATAMRRALEEAPRADVQQQTFSAGPYSQTLAFRVREADLFLSRLHRQMLTGGRGRNTAAFMIAPKPVGRC